MDFRWTSDGGQCWRRGRGWMVQKQLENKRESIIFPYNHAPHGVVGLAVRLCAFNAPCGSGETAVQCKSLDVHCGTAKGWLNVWILRLALH